MFTCVAPRPRSEDRPQSGSWMSRLLCSRCLPRSGQQRTSVARNRLPALRPTRIALRHGLPIGWLDQAVAPIVSSACAGGTTPTYLAESAYLRSHQWGSLVSAVAECCFPSPLAWRHRWVQPKAYARLGESENQAAVAQNAGRPSVHQEGTRGGRCGLAVGSECC